MGRKLILNHKHDAEACFPPEACTSGFYPVLAPLSGSYPRVQGRLLTCYAPVRHFTQKPKLPFSSDLHVLSTPPAFVLSQDQTLRKSFSTSLRTYGPLLYKRGYSYNFQRARQEWSIIYTPSLSLSIERKEKIWHKVIPSVLHALSAHRGRRKPMPTPSRRRMVQCQSMGPQG